MVRRLVVAVLGPVDWSPPGADPERWRRVLAEDTVDLLATVAQADAAVAVLPADRPLAAEIGWPGMPVYVVPDRSVRAVAAMAERDGYQQVAIIPADAPDLPGLVLAKLLRPLTTRPVAVAPAGPDRPGLLGVAVRLPLPDWLPETDLDDADPARLRAAAPSPGQVVVTPGWHRLRAAADLAGLDPALEGWDNTRALLSGYPAG
ncbi:hypothetical protein [Plantactinospora sp. KBS50]|uniref:hypothetical protein n=1 Tax=Plantactinospora sp. KBS50 TaxID=2024580 RepID=UPI000BAB1663|nr:hypothetical protein [Plantactinospora sp. KBS50]ASW56620.1 hypothetical protein CIK06_24355 [Plantactinospora sp. KBS50]